MSNVSGFDAPSINEVNVESIRTVIDQLTYNLNLLLSGSGGEAIVQKVIKATSTPSSTPLTKPASEVESTIRITSSPYYAAATSILFVDTDSGDITVYLPASHEGKKYKIINCGSSGNDVIVTPDGTELLYGDNAVFNLIDAEIINIHNNVTEGWW